MTKIQKNLISHLTILLSFVFSLMICNYSEAQDFNHQLNASSTSATIDPGIGDTDEFIFSLQSEYRLGINDTLQFALPLSIYTTKNYTAGSAGLGIIINFFDDIQNSIFVSADFNWTRISISSVGSTTSNTNAFHSIASIGKRFELVRNVSYEPSVDFKYGYGDYYAGDRIDLYIRLLSITVTL